MSGNYWARAEIEKDCRIHFFPKNHRDQNNLTLNLIEFCKRNFSLRLLFVRKGRKNEQNKNYTYVNPLFAYEYGD